MLFFLRIFKFNVVMYLYSIKEPNVPNLRNYTKVLPQINMYMTIYYEYI
jgi:hypothetical protein